MRRAVRDVLSMAKLLGYELTPAQKRAAEACLENGVQVIIKPAFIGRSEYNRATRKRHTPPQAHDAPQEKK